MCLTTSKFKQQLYQLKQRNAFLNCLEIILGENKITSYPPHLEIELTSCCNFSCFMCRRDELVIHQSEMPESLLKKIASILPYVESVLIAGLGEPLLSERLGLFMHLADRMGCAIHLFTNGSLIDKRLGLFKALSKVSISFDGATRKTFESLRRGSDFEQIIGNIGLLRSTYPSLHMAFSTVVSKANIGEIFEIVLWGAHLGINEINLSPMGHRPSLALDHSDQYIYEKEYMRARKLALFHNISLNNNVKPFHFYSPEKERGNFSAWVGKLAAWGRRTQLRGSSSLSKKKAAAQLLRLRNTVGEYSTTPYSTFEIMDSQNMDLTGTILLFEERINNLQLQCSTRPMSCVSLPHCLCPWNYLLVDSKGFIRLCPYAYLPVDTLEENGPTDLINNTQQRAIRESMQQKVPPYAVCKNCTDDHRFFNLNYLSTVGHSLGVSL